MGGIIQGALGGVITAGIVGLFVLFVWFPLAKTFRDPSHARFQAMRRMLETEWEATRRYKYLLSWFLGWVDHFFDKDDPNPSPWSVMTYDLLLGLAIVYPILSAFLVWVFSGHAGTLGIAIGMADSEDVLARLISLTGILAAFIGYFLFIRLDGWKSIAAVAVAGAGAVAGAVAVAVAGAGAGAGAVAFAAAAAVAGAGAGAVAFAGAVAVAVVFAAAVAGAGAGAGAVAFILAVLFLSKIARDKNRYGLFLAIFSTGYIVALFGALLFLAGEQADKNSFALLIGICLIPLINVVFDWGSIGLTRHLLRKNLSEGPGGWSTSRAVLDFIIAVVLLGLLAITLVSVLTLVDQIGYAKGMTTAIVGVDAVLAEILLDPAATQHWWIYFTLFSTLIPTFIHGVIAVASQLSVRLKFLDRRILGEMDEVAAADQPEDRIGHARRAAALVLAQWAFATFLVGAACYLIWTVTDHLTGAGEAFLTLLIWVQEMTAAGAAWVLW